VTGGVPRDAAIERQPLDDQPYPDDNSIGNPQPGDDYASIDPDQQIPPADQPKAAQNCWHNWLPNLFAPALTY